MLCLHSLCKSLLKATLCNTFTFLSNSFHIILLEYSITCDRVNGVSFSPILRISQEKYKMSYGIVSQNTSYVYKVSLWTEKGHLLLT